MKQASTPFIRFLVASALLLVNLSALIATPAYATANNDTGCFANGHLVISEFRTRGPSGASDEFVELFNASSVAVSIGGWKLNSSSSLGSVSTRATVSAGVVLQPHQHYLLTNSVYSGSVAGDQTYASGIVDNGGIAILDGSNVIIDQVGMNTTSAYKEGTVLAAMSATTDQSYQRQPVEAQDTDDNSADFVLNASSSAPQNLASYVGGCFTLTPTVTITTTDVETPTPTPTETMAVTETFTPTETVTVTPSPTDTESATATSTPTATETPTATVTATESATPTPTDTETPTATVTVTESATPTDAETPTATVTATESATPTPTDTETLTATVTVTESATPTDTETLTATVTVTESATPTPTDTETPTATVTETATATSTPTDAETPTATVTVTESATPTPTDTETPTKTLTRTPSKTVTKTPSKTATKTKTPVTITLTSLGVQDGWVLETSEISGVGGTLNNLAGTISLGDDSAKRQYRGVLSFATGASLPDSATITGVILKVKRQGIIGISNPLILLQGFLVDIKNGFFASANTLQISDFQAVSSGTYGPSSPLLVNSSYSFNLINGKAFINKLSSNNGLTQIRLRFNLDDSNDAFANILNLYSGEAANAADRPQLVITYLP